MDWKDGLTQSQVCQTLMNNGHALEFLGHLMKETIKDDHLVPIDRSLWMRQSPELDPSFAWDGGTALVLEVYLRKSDEVIVYQKKEVGSLIRFHDGAVGNAEGMALVDYLLKLPSVMTLNDSQIVELEYLLNKAGKTLGVALPDVRPASAEEKEAALRNLVLATLQAKPKHFYQRYVDGLKAAGTPVVMTSKEFLEYAEETLTSL